MALAKTIEHKRGATFTRAALLPVGALYAGGNWSAKSQAVDTLTGDRFDLTARLIAPIAPETRYTLHLYASASLTATWRAGGKLECDVDFIDSSAAPEPYTGSSNTFVILVKKDVTQ